TDPFSHRRLGLFQISAGIVRFLVTDLAVDHEDAVIVLEHMISNRAGKGVLSIGIDVHLYDAIAQCLANLLQATSRTAMEHEVETGCFPKLLGQSRLSVLQDIGT